MNKNEIIFKMIWNQTTTKWKEAKEKKTINLLCTLYATEDVNIIYMCRM